MEVAGVFVFLFTVLFVLIIALALYAVSGFFYMKVLEKDGRNGWLGFIPYYRDYLLIEMGELNWYWIIALCAPLILGIIGSVIPFVGSIILSICTIVSRIAEINIFYNLTRKFKTEDWLLIVIALFPLIGLAVIGLSDKYKYDKSVKIKPDGFFGDLGILKDEKKETVKEAKVVEEVKEEVKTEEKKPVKKTTTKKSTKKETKKDE